ncbi:MAG TPA: GMC oxidoreductase [Polyangiaceae bacterium]|nr:GMC oxidoreductase [Polyangiaceae bacterium]
MNLERAYDVVVVGSGAGGGTLAYGLAKKGARVLLVEKGDVVRSPVTKPATEPRIGFAQSEYGPSGSLPCVGGPTKFYGSALYRLRETDFKWSRLETGESAAWPIDYDDLEPYYGEAERTYSVHGSSGGDPTDPPRRAPYPFPPIPHQGLVKGLVERLANAGVSVGHIPRGLDYRDGGKCVLCATCDGYYCSLDAKMDAEIACVRPAVATGNVALATGTECLRVLLSPGGDRATGVQLRRGADEFSISAGRVAVCAGVMQTPLLLRRSRTPGHPAGIGNDYGCLGRYMCGHTVVTLVLPVGIAPLPPTHTKTFAINSFYGPSDDWPYPRGVIQMAGQLPADDQSPFVRALLARSLVVFCMTEEPSSRDRGLIFGDGDTVTQLTRAVLCTKSSDRLAKEAANLFRRSGCRVVLGAPGRNVGWHGVGSARMGADPRSSVVDSLCRVHGTENLFVVDSSALPSPGAVNTGLTLMALALRAADTISGQPPVRAVTQDPARDRARALAIATSDAQTDSATLRTRTGVVVIRGGICAKWRAIAAEMTPDGDDIQSHLGEPLEQDDVPASARGAGKAQHFQRGIIVERPDSRTFVVYGAIYDAYFALGAAAGRLGSPTSDEEDAGHGGRVSRFENGDIYWRADVGPRVAYGRKRKRYAGGRSPFTRSWSERVMIALRSLRRALGRRLRRARHDLPS